MTDYVRRITRGGCTLLISLCVGLPALAFSSSKLMLAKEGETSYTVVQSDHATEPEKYAVQELTNFLSRVTGASFPVVVESKLSGKTRGIYVGWTEYVARNGIEASKLGEEEWIIRTVGNNLILTGGRPRGTMYAVYEFLERQIGCHWLDRNTEVIPVMPTLKLGKLDIRGKPWFWRRHIHTAFRYRAGRGYEFLLRNKMYKPHSDEKPAFDYSSPTGAFYRVQGSPSFVHTFSYFVNASNWFESHPEYFSLNAEGKRVPAYDGAGPGQLCLTHPDVRRLTLKKLREYIAKDRADAVHQDHPPRIYDISQTDKYRAHCQCTNCQAIATREGGESGPLIDFINAIAEEIEKDYPDVLIQTLAYNQTSTPPKTLKPRHNVIIVWCDVYSLSDVVRPLNHPYNASQNDVIQAWGKIAPYLGIWDYWNSHGYYKLPTPYCIIQCLPQDLRLFADAGVETFFAESVQLLEVAGNFRPLQHWLAYKLLVNPYQPVDPLIGIFMEGYYGAAAPAMSNYLTYLMGRMDKEAEFKMTRDAPHKLKYLDLDFFVTAEKHFDEAEARVAPGSPEARHIQRERFIVDGALLHLWPWLDRKLSSNEKMPFDHESVVSRYEAAWRAYMKSHYSRFYSEPGQLAKIAALFRDPKLPEQFRNLPPRDVADFNWLTFSPYRPVKHFVDDQDAAGETAVAFIGGKDEEYRQALSFGVVGGATVTLKPEEIPQDGKYHVYKIGRINVKKGTTVWALKGKRLGVNVDRVYVPDAADPEANVWNAYISLKVKGPAFVKGSTETNGVWMDRVLLVKPQPGEKLDPAELLRQKEQKELDKKREARRPHVSVPCWPANAGGDPQKIDWKKSVNAGKWSTLKGAPTTRKVEARLAQDGKYLYIRLIEEVNTKTLINDPGIFGGDDWELFFAAKRGEQPYR
ncbi:DUF4838 domain-containing protein, partial [Verrucomicrobiota bacterium]